MHWLWAALSRWFRPRPEQRGGGVRFSAENVFIYIFVVVCVVLFGLAIYGKLSGRWEIQP